MVSCVGADAAGAACSVVVAVIGRLRRGCGSGVRRGIRELGLEACALLEERRARAAVDVVEELERVEVGLDRHDVARVGGDRLRGIRDLGAHVLGQGALGDEVLLEALDRVAALPVLDVARVAVAGGVVGVRVRLDAVGEALDQRRAAARPCPLDRGARDRVDRGDVVAVDVEAGHAVPDRLVGQGRGTGLARERDADRELVVLHEEDGRRLPDGREVEGLVRVALARGPVAEVGHGHDRVLAQARRVGEAHGMQGLRRERRRLRGGAVGVLVVPVVPVAAERLQDVAGLDAAGEQRDAVAIGREEPVARLDRRDGADLAGLLAVRGGVGRQPALLGERGHLHVEATGDHHAPVELEERLGVGQVEAAGG